VPDAERVKHRESADNRKARANRNTTYALPALPAEDEVSKTLEVKRRLRAMETPERVNARTYYGPFDPDVAVKVIEYRRQGLSALAISRKPGMPRLNTIADWKRDSEEFAELYAEAYNEWLEAIVEQTVDLADSAYDGRRPLNPAAIVAIYNAIKTRQWLIGRRISDRYGDRVDSGQEQIILQPQEIATVTGSQGPQAERAAQEYARLRDAPEPPPSPAQEPGKDPTP
jgi:hypothetical protein